ncbi:hypothetical protein BDN67DRAFT_982973 [Paxillus ammoniavirescens]|nr:hypothetical protein BDN67DRAFT_982973 [Paxillus ammoniavirescens]
MQRPMQGRGEAATSDSDEHFVLEVEGSDEDDSDVEQITSVFRMPAADADIPELRKALGLCQKTLVETRAELAIAMRDLCTLNAALLAKKCRNVMDKTDKLNEDIGRITKKFTILHRLWVISGLFPIKNNPNVDLWSASRWELPVAKRDAVLTELFMATPEPLHKEMAKYKSFSSVFTSTLNQERSNMLRAVKEALALIFAPLKVPDATIFASPARKRDDVEMKNTLTKEKARGGPKVRGQIHSIHSVTEGLIALAAIFVHYLLSPDPELQIVGSETKIPYEADYDFYLEHLFKHSKWAINTVSWFNTELFGSKQQTNVATEPTAPPAPTHTWEDDFLDSLDNAMEPAVPVLIGTLEDPVHSLPPSPIHPSPSPLLRRLSPLSSPPLADPLQITTSSAMVSIHNHPGATLSSVLRLQLEVGQMSISSPSDPRNQPTNVQIASANCWVSSTRRAPVPVHVSESLMPPAAVPEAPLIQNGQGPWPRALVGECKVDDKERAASIPLDARTITSSTNLGCKLRFRISMIISLLLDEEAQAEAEELHWAVLVEGKHCGSKRVLLQGCHIRGRRHGKIYRTSQDLKERPDVTSQGDCTTVNVKLRTRTSLADPDAMQPPSFLDLTDSEDQDSYIPTPVNANHSDHDGHAVEAHRQRTYIWDVAKVANGNEKQASTLRTTDNDRQRQLCPLDGDDGGGSLSLAMETDRDCITARAYCHHIEHDRLNKGSTNK